MPEFRDGHLPDLTCSTVPPARTLQPPLRGTAATEQQTEGQQRVLPEGRLRAKPSRQVVVVRERVSLDGVPFGGGVSPRYVGLLRGNSRLHARLGGESTPALAHLHKPPSLRLGHGDDASRRRLDEADESQGGTDIRLGGEHVLEKLDLVRLGIDYFTPERL